MDSCLLEVDGYIRPKNLRGRRLGIRPAPKCQEGFSTKNGAAAIELGVRNTFNRRRRTIMLNWALTFLIIGLIAGLLGLSGIAGTATQIAWILFVIFIILFIISLVLGRRPRI
jgi:uncharacterized membrane protein YtjA (UPF0391 family)